MHRIMRATMPELTALTKAMPAKCRCMVLIASWWTALRWVNPLKPIARTMHERRFPFRKSASGLRFYLWAILGSNQ